MAETLTTEVDNLLVIHNPYSGDQEGIQRRLLAIEDFARYSDLPRSVVSSEPDVQGTMELLQEKVTPGSLIEVCGGDGEWQKDMDGLERLGLPNIMTVIVGGSAADNSHMLHPHPTKGPSYSYGLAEGKTGMLHPLEIKASHPSIDKEDHRSRLITSAYFSIGFTALMADHFNKPEVRQKLDGSKQMRYLKQVKETWDMSGRQEELMPFAMTDENGEQILGELTFPNGSQMAGSIRFRGLDLLEPRFGELDVLGQVTRGIMAKTIVEAGLGRFAVHEKGEIRKFSITAIDQHGNEAAEFLAEANGEASIYPSGTQFEIGLSDKTIPVLTTSDAYN